MTKLTEFLQTLRDRLPLSVVVMRHANIKKKGREFTGLCPFHNEKGASFTVNDEKGFYHCFGCGVHGDLFNFIMEKLNLPFMEAVEYLADQAGMSVPPFEGRAKEGETTLSRNERDVFYDIHDVATQWFETQLRTPEAAPVRDYLKKRGMTGDIAKQFRIGYAPDRGLKEFLRSRGFTESDCQQCGLIIVPDGGKSSYDRFRQRVMFPIQDQRGRVIAFGGRIIRQGEPKYLNSPETPLFHKGRQLYGLNYAIPTARAGNPYVVVEGYMDVIAMHQAGITGAVAPLGTALTPEQLSLMWRTCTHPVLCFDGDTAGRRAAYRAVDRVLEIIKPGYSIGFCFLPEGEDPDSLIQKSSVSAIRELLSQPKPLIDVLWQIFIEQRPLTTPEQKAKARQDLLTLTQTIQDPDIRHFYREDLSSRLQDKLRSMRGSQNFFKQAQTPQLNLLQGHKQALNENKIALGEKILLAILINHPTLISEVAEQLMMITPENPAIYKLRDLLLEYITYTPYADHIHLMDYLRKKGFGDFIETLLTRRLYEKARFTHPTTPYDEVLAGWQEVWRSIQTQQHLKVEVHVTSTELKSTLDDQSWQKLKALKTTVGSSGIH